GEEPRHQIERKVAFLGESFVGMANLTMHGGCVKRTSAAQGLISQPHRSGLGCDVKQLERDDWLNVWPRRASPSSARGVSHMALTSWDCADAPIQHAKPPGGRW